RLYHERWEIESAYFALRHTLLNGHVLRSGDRPGLEQETWALLMLYQLLRMAMVDAVETRPGTDPDRASFTTAMQAAKDQLTAPPRRDRTAPAPPRPPTRQERITAIITSQPPRDWSGHELALLLGVKPRNILTQLGQWARQGFFTRTGFGTYRLNTPSDQTPST